MKKVLVTGCAGFIGSHTCEKLIAEGYHVTGIDNFDDFYPRSMKERNIAGLLSSDNFDFLEGNICNTNDLNHLAGNVDLVIHLAAKAGVRPSTIDPDSFIENNINGTHQVLKWMHRNNINKLVFGSSSSIYGNNKKVPFCETDNVDFPISPYALTKKSCELLNYTYHSLYAIDVVNLRFFTVYGPRQRPDLAIRKFIELIKRDEPLPVFGDGSSSRDYTYIDDIVDGILKAALFVDQRENVYETFNIGNSSPIKLSELLELLYEIFDKEPKLSHLPMQEGDVNRTYADISKAKNLLGYSPLTPFKNGLEKFRIWLEST
jgi:UDP-glucuronate 4-epimerase